MTATGAAVNASSGTSIVDRAAVRPSTSYAGSAIGASGLNLKLSL
jgi:hypothetical protein